MWGAIASFLGDYMKGAMGNANPQGASTGANVAAGAQNPGVGSLWKDMAAGNYGSAAGNVAQMGQQAQRPMQQQQPPQMPQSTPAQVQQQPMMGAQQSPYLQQLMARYMR